VITFSPRIYGIVLRNESEEKRERLNPVNECASETKKVI